MSAMKGRTAELTVQLGSDLPHCEFGQLRSFSYCVDLACDAVDRPIRPGEFATLAENRGARRRHMHGCSDFVTMGPT